MQCELGKPKLALAQRGSKFAGAQSFKQLISSSLLQQRGMVQLGLQPLPTDAELL